MTGSKIRRKAAREQFGESSVSQIVKYRQGGGRGGHGIVVCVYGISWNGRQKRNMKRGWTISARKGEIDRVPELFRYFRWRAFEVDRQEVYGITF